MKWIINFLSTGSSNESALCEMFHIHKFKAYREYCSVRIFTTMSSSSIPPRWNLRTCMLHKSQIDLFCLSVFRRFEVFCKKKNPTHLVLILFNILFHLMFCHPLFYYIIFNIVYSFTPMLYTFFIRLCHLCKWQKHKFWPPKSILWMNVHWYIGLLLYPIQTCSKIT